MSRRLLLASVSVAAMAQAPMLQDGAAALRQARLDWALGQAPLEPSSLPSFEVGWGGAGSEGAYAPLVGGEGLGIGTLGWGLGLQGRVSRGGFSVSATALALRTEGRTLGVLQRAALAYRTESGWRLALEAAPLAWGAGLNGGDLLGDGARSLPRLSLATPEAALTGLPLMGRWRLEAFAGRLEADRPIPPWIVDRRARLEARAAGVDLQRPLLWGGLVRTTFGTRVETAFGALTMEGGRDAQGRPAPAAATRTATLVEMRIRIPELARLVRARGASATLSRSAAPDGRSLALAPGRTLGGLQLVWEGWDLGVEYAGAAPRATISTTEPSHLAGFSTHGDPLGPAFGPQATTRTVELGLPLFLEGQGRLRAMRVTAPLDPPSGGAFWFLQGEAQWRTPTGRAGASVATRRHDLPAAPGRWGWSFAAFQAFRVF
ncbi:MAG: capsule assembly Wzi family protein [Holophagaceae bacterium]|nr:capsule assembly Wzi family protein [Holophagaceae bacterium]